MSFVNGYLNKTIGRESILPNFIYLVPGNSKTSYRIKDRIEKSRNYVLPLHKKKARGKLPSSKSTRITVGHDTT